MSKKIETIGKVYQTTDYDQFKRIDGNRQIKTSGQKWRLLLESIRDHGQMAPAIVNGRNEIIDGQHRLEACRICGQPFKYVVNGGAGFNDIPEANLGDQWKLIDFIHAYASQGYVDYQMFDTLLDEFIPPLNISSIRAISLVDGEGSQFRNGTLEFSAETRDKVSACIRGLLALGYHKWVKDNPRSTKAFWPAVAYCWRHPGVDVSKLIDKINQNTHRIPSTTKTLEYLNVFGEIYNKGRRKDQRVYLDTDYERGLYVTWEGDK